MKSCTYLKMRISWRFTKRSAIKAASLQVEVPMIKMHENKKFSLKFGLEPGSARVSTQRFRFLVEENLHTRTYDGFKLGLDISNGDF